jgi:hypothetical protein
MRKFLLFSPTLLLSYHVSKVKDQYKVTQKPIYELTKAQFNHTIVTTKVKNKPTFLFRQLKLSCLFHSSGYFLKADDH